MEYSSGTVYDATTGLLSDSGLESFEFISSREAPGHDVDFLVGFTVSPYHDVKVMDEIEKTFAEIDMRAHYAALEFDPNFSV